MKWTALLLLAIVISPAAVAVGVIINAHITMPANATASPVSAEPPVLLDPIDTDGPGGVCSVALRVNIA